MTGSLFFLGFGFSGLFLVARSARHGRVEAQIILAHFCQGITSSNWYCHNPSASAALFCELASGRKNSVKALLELGSGFTRNSAACTGSDRLKIIVAERLASG